MTHEARRDEVFEIESSETGGVLAHLPWWLILTVAFIVTELTAHPAIGVSVLCLKFGWNDFRTALWLWNRDPIRKRGTVCSMFYIASGLWKVCLSSLGLMFVAIFFLVAMNLAPGPPGGPNANPAMPPEVMTCMIMWLASFCVATLLTILSAALAWLGGIKVWVSGRITESRRQNVWPPRPTRRLQPEMNLLKWILIGAGASTFVVLFIVGAITLRSVVDGINRQAPILKNPNAKWIEFLVLMGTPLVTGLVILLVGGWILGKIGAKSVAECWPDESLVAVLDSSD